MMVSQRDSSHCFDQMWRKIGKIDIDKPFDGSVWVTSCSLFDPQCFQCPEWSIGWGCCNFSIPQNDAASWCWFFIEDNAFFVVRFSIKSLGKHDTKWHCSLWKSADLVTKITLTFLFELNRFRDILQSTRFLPNRIQLKAGLKKSCEIIRCASLWVCPVWTHWFFHRHTEFLRIICALSKVRSQEASAGDRLRDGYDYCYSIDCVL